MGDQSKIVTDLVPDESVVLDANYRMDRHDRRYVDNQIVGCETHLSESLLNGIHATWGTLDSSSDPVTVGDCLCTAFGNPVKVNTTTIGNSAAALGVALSSAGPNTKIRYAIAGYLPNSVTGLGPGLTEPVRVNTTTGRLERVGTLSSGDISVGIADTLGGVVIEKGVGGAGGGGGGGATFGKDVIALSPTQQKVVGIQTHAVTSTTPVDEQILKYDLGSDTYKNSSVYRIFNVRDYGAKGDYNATLNSGTDDTLAFRAARDAMYSWIAANPSKNTGRFYMPGGTYGISGEIQFWCDEGLILEGDGIGRTVLYWIDVDPTASPTVTSSIAGTLGAGEYQFCYAWIDARGDSYISPFSIPISVTGTQGIRVTVPTGPSGTTGRRVYVTEKNTPNKLLLAGTISDNTTTTFDYTANVDGTFVLNQYVGRAVVRLTACWHSRVRDFTIAGNLNNYIESGIQLEGNDTRGLPYSRGFGISTRNVIERVNISSGIDNSHTGVIGHGIRIGNNTDPGNNDFHTIRDCSIAYTRTAAIGIPDSQAVGHVIHQVLMQGAGATGSVTDTSGETADRANCASITAGTNVLVHDGAIVFRWHDIGKTIDVQDAGTDTGYATGKRLHTKIVKILSSNQLQLADNAVNTVSNKSIWYGTEHCVQNMTDTVGFFTGGFGGSFQCYGCAGGDVMRSNFIDGTYGSDCILVVGFSDEGGRGLYETGLDLLGDKGHRLSDIRWAGNGCRPEFPYAINWNSGGRLSIDNCSIGTDPNQYIQISIGGFFGVDDTLKLVSITNTSVYSKYATGTVLHGTPPNICYNLRHHDPSGAVFMLGPDYISPAFFVGGPITVTFGHSRVCRFAVNSDTSITLDDQGVIRGLSAEDMYIYAVVGSSTANITWVNSITWIKGPFQVKNGTIAVFHVKRDGSGNFYVEQLNSPLDARPDQTLMITPEHSQMGATAGRRAMDDILPSYTSTTTATETIADIGPLTQNSRTKISVSLIGTDGTDTYSADIVRTFKVATGAATAISTTALAASNVEASSGITTPSSVAPSLIPHPTLTGHVALQVVPWVANVVWHVYSVRFENG